jgi:hypothetical protein
MRGAPYRDRGPIPFPIQGPEEVIQLPLVSADAKLAYEIQKSRTLGRHVDPGVLFYQNIT